MRFLHLNFLPRSADTALLLLRIWHGGSLLLLHGWGKFTGLSSMADKFADPFGLGPTASLALAVLGELVCTALIVLGLFTRIAVLGSAATMATAFWYAHGRPRAGCVGGIGLYGSACPGLVRSHRCPGTGCHAGHRVLVRPRRPPDRPRAWRIALHLPGRVRRSLYRRRGQILTRREARREGLRSETAKGSGSARRRRREGRNWKRVGWSHRRASVEDGRSPHRRSGA